MVKKVSKLDQIRANAQALLEEPTAEAQGQTSKLHRFAHFWVLVWRSFSRNRCPVRASALAYATLLALIPMLAVVMSITSSILKKQGEDRIQQFIGEVVSSVTPPANLNTNLAVAATTSTTDATGGPAVAEQNPTDHSVPGNAPQKGAQGEDKKLAVAQETVAHHINDFIQNTRSGALGVTGSAVLIFVAISMLSRIETTFNDIWGVARGRTWFMRIVLYWGVLTLAPILLVVALGLATGPHLQSTKKLFASLPFVGSFLAHLGFQLLPIVVLCLTFAAFYMLMPNAKVHWKAALAGGLTAGLLFHLNNLVSVLYVSRVISNSKIYGSLGLVPVFMVGLYFSWLIMLFGAQVAYAYQNRTTYAEEKQVENVNQRGREFIALRLMTSIGQRYLRGEPPCTVVELAEQIGVPTRLIRQIMQTLAASRLVVETAGAETAYLPARPMEGITCHDILLALRSSQGQELATRDEPSRTEVYGEFQRIQEAERQAASSVTMLALANRAQARAQIAG